MKTKFLLLLAIILLFTFPTALAHGWHASRIHIGVNIGIPLYYGYNYSPVPVIYTANPPITNEPQTIAYRPQIYRTPYGVDYVYTTYYPQSCVVSVTTFHHEDSGRVWFQTQQYGDCGYAQ